MSVAKKPGAVKLFAAIMCKNDELFAPAKAALVTKWGPIEEESKVVDFIFSDYYKAEMGTSLKKQFVVFQKLIQRESISDAKIFSNHLEQTFLLNEKRQVNIDPGYITPAKLVLATTKNYAHRLYLRDGIFGDIHLTVRDRKFIPNEWAYPDYKTPESIAFFNHIRSKYLAEIFKHG